MANVEDFTKAMWAIQKPADVANAFGVAMKAKTETPQLVPVMREIWNTWCGFVTTPSFCKNAWPKSL